MRVRATGRRGGLAVVAALALCSVAVAGTAGSDPFGTAEVGQTVNGARRGLGRGRRRAAIPELVQQPD
jgi:hypothetical protein